MFSDSQIALNLLIPIIKDYRVLFAVQDCTIFGAALFTLLYTETPFFQFWKGTFGHFRRSLEHIARFNNSKEEVDQVLKQMNTDLRIPQKGELVSKDVENEDQAKGLTNTGEISQINETRLECMTN